MIKELVDEYLAVVFGRSGGEHTEREENPDLGEIFGLLGAPVGEQMAEYLASSIPTRAVGSIVELHPAEVLVEENTECNPGMEAIEQGFLCFAKEGDGSQFAYNVHDHRVYHLGFTVGDSEEETVRAAWDSWDDLRQFFQCKTARLTK